MKKILLYLILVFQVKIVLAQNDISPTGDIKLGQQAYLGNALQFQGWGESHFLRSEAIGNTPNGKTRLRIYLADDWTYDQGFEIIAHRYDGLERSLLYIPGDGSQTNFFSGASFGNDVKIKGNILITNADLPMSLSTEVLGTSPLLNLHVNFHSPTVNTSYIGAAFRIDTRPLGQLPVFQWLKRSANSSTEAEVMLMALNEQGNLSIGISTPPRKTFRKWQHPCA
ncbi:hypothetical protein [Pedobacter sp. MW01-1-1]|uniref:hypothetical protein n=1 Tax=Pedobacter sp. MW01-1-1 TaxID=3383027 RepID=UPI003FEF2E40